MSSAMMRRFASSTLVALVLAGAVGGRAIVPPDTAAGASLRQRLLRDSSVSGLFPAWTGKRYVKMPAATR
jgi:hypothetical protein